MITSTSVLFAAAIAASLTANAAVQTAPSPCRVIREACLKAGFQPGKGPGGVSQACLTPIVYETPPPKGAKPALPAIDPKLAADCRANLERAQPAKAPATPTSTEEPSVPSTRLPTAVSPHNPPPTDPGPN